MKRTSYCGELRKADVGKQHVLTGWVQSRRDHGGCIFIDLRDRTGIVQIVLDPQIDAEAHRVGNAIRSEFVLEASGAVRDRMPGTVNTNLPTGEVELAVTKLAILNTAKTPPFLIEDDEDLDRNDDLRMTYRYLDMRRPRVAKALQMRHKAAMVVRNYFDRHGFLEVETPMLTKSTPEGARDFLVPSRLNPGSFYAMPQSPQLFKQMLMIAGMDKYFQIVKCFRDEDLRADRQPEFTQIDVEMSFIERDDVLTVVEGLMEELFALIDVKIETPFRRMPYAEAVGNYGVDKPDLRFGMELVDVGDLAAQSTFRVFKTVTESGGLVKGIRVPGGAKLSRSEIDALTKFVGNYGAKGLAWMRVTDDGIDSPIAKFFESDTLTALRDRMGGESGDLLMFVADTTNVTHAALGALRVHLAHKLGLIQPDTYEFVWVVDFPLVERNEDENRWDAMHHPFTSPHPEDIPLLDTDPGKVRSNAYDLAVNGQEIWGGSVRIHDAAVQEKVFRMLQLSDDDIQLRFGFFLDALKYGTPPHGGIACGFDRLVALLAGETSIREVIPFPKTSKGVCLVTGGPSTVDDKQLAEVFIKVDLPEEDE
ncbi:MAG: aspartate--tRNA ligase [Candidatus Poribacteria bacterium]|nr:aspartate--tRNA ligase [Candidatus Poribacteria bacterium]